MGSLRGPRIARKAKQEVVTMAKMLVVDDDPAWRALYRMGFEADFEVFEAVDGLDALAALDRVRPDVIVLDLKMPHLDGMGLLRQMERRGLKVPVVVCSGMFTMDSPPAIPGVFPATKSPDLRNVWSALEAAMPRRPVEVDLSLKPRRAIEATHWRD
jgi:DNA-binding NtrC family response regulator